MLSTYYDYNDELGSHRLKVTPEVVDWPHLASLPQSHQSQNANGHEIMKLLKRNHSLLLLILGSHFSFFMPLLRI